MNKKGTRTTAFLALLIAIILITSNIRGSDNSELFAKISDKYYFVDAIDVEYEDESREPVTLTSAYLAQVKQAFAPKKLDSSKKLNIKGFAKLATLTYRIGDEVLFTAPLYIDETGEIMYEIIAKEKYASSKAILFLNNSGSITKPGISRLQRTAGNSRLLNFTGQGLPCCNMVCPTNKSMAGKEIILGRSLTKRYYLYIKYE